MPKRMTLAGNASARLLIKFKILKFKNFERGLLLMSDKGITKLSDDALENVSGGTTDPAALNAVIADYRAKNPNGKADDLLQIIRLHQNYAIETQDDVRLFRFYYDSDSEEMQFVMKYIKEHF